MRDGPVGDHLDNGQIRAVRPTRTFVAITFVSNEVDVKVLNSVQDRFDVSITEVPEKIEPSIYIEK